MNTDPAYRAIASARALLRLAKRDGASALRIFANPKWSNFDEIALALLASSCRAETAAVLLLETVRAVTSVPAALWASADTIAADNAETILLHLHPHARANSRRKSRLDRRPPTRRRTRLDRRPPTR